MFKTIAIVWTAALVIGLGVLGYNLAAQPAATAAVPTTPPVPMTPEDAAKRECINRALVLMWMFKEPGTDKPGWSGEKYDAGERMCQAGHVR